MNCTVDTEFDKAIIKVWLLATVLQICTFTIYKFFSCQRNLRQEFSISYRCYVDRPANSEKYSGKISNFLISSELVEHNNFWEKNRKKIIFGKNFCSFHISFPKHKIERLIRYCKKSHLYFFKFLSHWVIEIMLGISNWGYSFF